MEHDGGVVVCVCVAEDLDEMNIEIMRNTLYKAYLDDFAAFCNKLGGTTGEVMGSLLAFEVLPTVSACSICTTDRQS